MGKTNTKKYTLPKEYISWGQFNLWNSSKTSYRKRYYTNAPGIDTAELRFGKKIAKMLEDNHPSVEHIEKLSTMEKEFNIEFFGGIKIFGFMDSFEEEEVIDFDLLEYKTGKVPWTRLKVSRHGQLPFYAVAINLLTGRTEVRSKLIHIETEGSVINFRGFKLQPVDKGLRLRGEEYVYDYERVMEEWEIEHMKEEIIRTIKEIHDDYKQWREENPLGAHEGQS